jgi:putative flavoprotein involved in K+ transport
VTLAIGTRNTCVPQRILGRDLFWWQTRTGLLTAAASSRRGRWMRRGEGTVIGQSTGALRRRGVIFRPRLIAAEGTAAVFADGQRLEVDAVVWATGFRRDHTWIRIPDALGDSTIRHRGSVTPVPGLYVLGLPWQRSAGSALIGYVGNDAAQLGGLIRSQAVRGEPG